MKKWVLAVSAAIFLTGMGAARAALVDRIVAIVNEDIITLSELNEAFEPYRERIMRTSPPAERDRAMEEAKVYILNRLIDNRLIEQQAKKKGVVVRDDEVMAYISRILENKKMDLPQLVKTLEESGTNLEKYKEELRADMLRKRLIRREIQSKIVVSDEEIGEYYRKHREDYEGKEAVRLKQILLPYPPGAEEEKIKELKNKAETIRERILKGEPFELMAAQFSQGPAANRGGDLGFIERGNMLPEVEEVAFKIPVGNLSPVIQSPVGFHLILVTEKKGAGIKPLSEVRLEIMQKIEEKKMAERFDQWIEEFRKMSLIEIRYP